MDIINIFISPEGFKAMSVYMFLVVVLLSSLKLLIWKDSEEKISQKIIGGFAVFVVAIISSNNFVFVVSLFIGGLIIASEDFMHKLAIIFRSKSEDIAKNLKIEPATQKEVEDKQKEEHAEISYTKLEEKQDRRKFLAERDKVKNAERLAMDYLLEEYGVYYESEVKIGGQYGNIIVDGIIYDSPTNKNISKIVEIKFIKNKKNSLFVQFLIKRILERIRFLLIDVPVMVVIIAEDLDKEKARMINRKAKSYGNVSLIFFNMVDNNKLEPIYI